MTQRTRIASYALITHDAKIVLCRLHPKIDSKQPWTLPGGGIDFGEDPIDAMTREVFEETGLNVKPGEIATVDSIQPNERSHSLRIIYFAELIGAPDLRPEVEGSTDLCAWWSEEDARALPLVSLATLGLDLAF